MSAEILYVVPCSAKKARTLKAGPMPAREAYTGQGFRAIRHQLERAGAKWCILSGHYGFIWPTTIIEDYDVKMEPVDQDTVWETCFQFMSNRQYGELMTAGRIVVVGSRLYRDAAAALLKRDVEGPLVGLSIGRMLHTINRGDWLERNPAA